MDNGLSIKPKRLIKIYSSIVAVIILIRLIKKLIYCTMLLRLRYLTKSGPNQKVIKKWCNQQDAKNASNSISAYVYTIVPQS